MSATPATRPQRRYTDAERAQALAALDCNGGNFARTSEATGIPDSTLEGWANGTRNPAPPGMRDAIKETLALRFQAVVAQSLGIVEEKLPLASAAQAAVIAGIATEKMLLLRGEATAITQHQDDARLTALEAQYGQLRAVVPITDATTAPEPPATSHTMPLEGPNSTPDGQPPY